MDFNLQPIGNWFLSVFTETAYEVERNKINSGKFQKLTDVFLKQIYSKS